MSHGNHLICLAPFGSAERKKLKDETELVRIEEAVYTL